MKIHLVFLLVATVVWAGFWLNGLPSYYQQCSTRRMIWFDALVLIPIASIGHLFLRRVRAERRLSMALWLAFHNGLYLGHGAQFLWKYWCLTVYYAIPWIVLPGTTLHLNRRKEETVKGRH